jgi:hypothetical protein
MDKDYGRESDFPRDDIRQTIAVDSDIGHLPHSSDATTVRTKPRAIPEVLLFVGA